MGKSILYSIFSIIVFSFLVFVSLRAIPGSPTSTLGGIGESINEDARISIEEKLGLNKPLLEQYLSWTKELIHGDFGVSLLSKAPVLDLVVVRLPKTLLLSASSLFIGLAAAFFFGMASAISQNKSLTGILKLSILLSQSLPTYLVGIALLLTFAQKLGLLPAVSGLNPSLKSLVLPAVCLGISIFGLVTRYFRTSLLAEYEKPYVLTSLGKGLSRQQVFIRSILKNSTISMLPIIATSISYSLSGSIIVETVFAWPGIGTLLYQAVLGRDYPIVQGVALILAVLVIILNLIFDTINIALNPKLSSLY